MPFKKELKFIYPETMPLLLKSVVNNTLHERSLQGGEKESTVNEGSGGSSFFSSPSLLVKRKKGSVFTIVGKLIKSGVDG